MLVTRRLVFAAACATLMALAVRPDPAPAQASASLFTTGFRYDPAGRQVGVIRPDADGDMVGLLAQRTIYGARGLVDRVEYGSLAAWQSDSIAPSAWTGFTIFHSVEFGYDTRGRKIQERKVAQGAIRTLTEYAYDDFDRLRCTAIRMHQAGFSSAAVGGCDQRSTDPANPDRITRHSYDNRDRVTQVEKGVGTNLAQVHVAYTYNAGDKPLSLVDANGNRAEMTYDGFERQKRWIFPSRTSLPPAPVNPADYEEYDYDSNGNRTSLRKRDGSVLTFQYDALNRMTAKIVPERAGLTAAQTRDVHYQYDLRGHQTKARFDALDGEGVTTYYDGFGRPVTTLLNMLGFPRYLQHAYDANGNRIRLTFGYPQTTETHFGFGYDGLDRMNLVHDNAGVGHIDDYVIRYWYKPEGPRHAAVRGAGMVGFTTIYYYDRLNRPEAILNDLPVPDADSSVALSYNPASQIAQRVQNNDAYVWRGHYNVARDYRRNGLNQYTQTLTGGTPSASFDYDANGNLVSDGSSAFVYDVENRLVSASGAKNATLVYDPLGRLVQVSSAATGATQFLYEGDKVVAEYNGSGTFLRRYVHGPGADEPVAVYEGAALGVAGRRYMLPDERGSIVGLVNASGSPSAVNTYDSWGIPGANNAGRFQYTGQAWLPELGMYHYKARIYSPTLGRFLQTDPIGYDDQVNLYAYVGNDPINRSDPTGLRSENPKDDPDLLKKARERPTRTARTPQDRSIGASFGRFIARAGVLLGIALAIDEENEKQDKIKVYRIFGGKAGLLGSDDAGTGSYWTTEDPRQHDNRREIRDRYALPPKWGNAVTKLAIGHIEAGNQNITTWGTAQPERQGREIYRGGAPEMTIRNSIQNVRNLRVENLNVSDH